MPNNLFQRNATVSLLILLAGMLGCGDELHPVEGQLVWEDGQPAKELDGSMLYFVSSEHHTTSRSIVQNGGRFELTTNEPESQGVDGVPPGVHQVYIIANDSANAPIDSRFRDPDTSGLEVTVPPSDGQLELKIARSKSKRKLAVPGGGTLGIDN